MNSVFSQIVGAIGGLGTIFTCVMLFVKPIRERVLGTKQVKEGQRCLLRSDMLHTYYKHRETETIRQYEKENFIMEYKAYKVLGGNSFIDDIEKEVRSWEVLS